MILFETPEIWLEGMEFGKLLRHYLKSPKYTLNHVEILYMEILP